MTCQGVVKREFSPARCYLDLCYTAATVGVKGENDFDRIVDDINELRDRLQYSYIDLSVLK